MSSTLCIFKLYYLDRTSADQCVTEIIAITNRILISNSGLEVLVKEKIL